MEEEQVINTYDLFNGFLEKINEIDNEDDLKGLQNIIEILPENRELIKEMKSEFKIAQLTRDDVIELKRYVLSMFDAVEEDEKAKGLDKKKNDLINVYKESLQNLFNVIIIGYDRETVDVAIELCHDNAVMPKYAHEGDAGFDFYLAEDIEIAPGETKIAPTGLKMRIPMGYELQVRPRSGMSAKTKLRIANAPGTIDCGYADLIGIICENIGTETISLKTGERIAQGVLNEVPRAHFIQIKDLSEFMKDEDRGGGFGSTGK